MFDEECIQLPPVHISSKPNKRMNFEAFWEQKVTLHVIFLLFLLYNRLKFYTRIDFLSLYLRSGRPQGSEPSPFAKAICIHQQNLRRFCDPCQNSDAINKNAAFQSYISAYVWWRMYPATSYSCFIKTQ